MYIDENNWDQHISEKTISVLISDGLGSLKVELIKTEKRGEKQSTIENYVRFVKEEL